MKKTEDSAQITAYRQKDNALIQCEGIWKIYNEGKSHEVSALIDINLEMDKCSFTVFNGPSGSGKTTLISIIGTMDRPGRGRLIHDGKDVTDFSDIALSRLRREKIGFVFQNFNLIPGLSAWENVAMPLIPQGVGERVRRSSAMNLLSKLGLSDRVNHRAEEMSGGEQQRVAIARALVNDPVIIILDEPTSNIDSESASLLMEILKKLQEEGKTILASSHDEDLIRHADRVHLLKKGCIFSPLMY